MRERPGSTEISNGSLRRLPGGGHDHPLTRIRQIVEELGAVPDQARLIRAALLQSLYSFACSELLLDQLRYNWLYRWFVGLGADEAPWSSHDYQVSLERLRTSPAGAALLRMAMLRAHACAAENPDRFRVDRTLVGLWTSGPAHGGRDPGQPDGADHRDRARFDRARALILERIGDPALSPEKIAADMCMSRRALYLLFGKYGQTPSGAVRELRLECCRRLLSDPRHRHRKITDIAMDCGFVHTGTFSRQFKERYGHSPLSLRAGREIAEWGGVEEERRATAEPVLSGRIGRGELVHRQGPPWSGVAPGSSRLTHRIQDNAAAVGAGARL